MLDTFCAFIDLKKTFDCVDKNLLSYKLLMYNIDRNVFKAMNGLYGNR